MNDLFVGIGAILWIVFVGVPFCALICYCVVFCLRLSYMKDRARDLYRRTLSDEENRIITDYLSVSHGDYKRLKEYGEVESTK